MKYKEERLFRFIQKCERNKHNPDLHSFMIEIDSGKAYVEARDDGVWVRTWQGDRVTDFIGTAIAATNRLEMLHAKFETIDM